MVKERQVRRIIGTGAIAKSLGVSRVMIYKVARGQAISSRIANALRANGITVEPYIFSEVKNETSNSNRA